MAIANLEGLESEGRYDQAFAAIQEYNLSLAHGLDRPSFDAALAATQNDIIRKFDTGRLRDDGGGNGSAAPIFIVGMPRSGSTLVEQVLATHSQVQGMGECIVLGKLLAADMAWMNAELLTPSKLRSMSANYIGGIKALGWKPPKRFVDKSLGNYEAIGLIHIMFPRCRIINVVRDPIDVCFSAFRVSLQPFGEAVATGDLASCGRMYRRYRRMMDHWNTVLPGRVLEVSLERLVGDFDAEAKRLVAACGLPWDERCLRFYENPREVKTASADQVRQPIFTESLGRWRHYRKHLGPLIEALGPYAPKDV